VVELRLFELISQPTFFVAGKADPKKVSQQPLENQEMRQKFAAS